MVAPQAGATESGYAAKRNDEGEGAMDMKTTRGGARKATGRGKRRAAKGRGVSEGVRKLVAAARTEGTVAGYRADMRHFANWGGRVPASASSVANYLAELAETHAFATVKRRTAALTLAHHERGVPSPCHTELVRSTLRGIRRRKPGEPGRRQPLLAEQVVAAVRGERGIRAARDRALLMLGFAGAFRRSELVALDVGDLGMRGNAMVVTVRRGKTDQEGRGREVVVPKGATRGRCAVAAVVAWLEGAGIREGAVFRRVDRHGNVLGGRLGADAVGSVVKRYAAKLGLDPRLYGGHSLRAGYVTSAVMKGIPMWAVKAQTGHSRETMVECYIRVPGNAAPRRVL